MDNLMDDFAELLAGCQVPCSMGVLGAAKAPFDAIRDKLGAVKNVSTRCHRDQIEAVIAPSVIRESRLQWPNSGAK